MICSSPIIDKYFHEEFFQSIFSLHRFHLVRNQFRRYVERLFHCEIFCILDGMPIVWVILHHEYRWFQCWRHEHSPYQKIMFFAVFCNIHWRAFLPFSHLIIHPIQEWSGSYRQIWFCFVVPNDKLLCSSLRANNGFHRSIVIFLLPKYDVLVFTRETWLKRLCSSLRTNNGFHRSIIHQFISFPLLRRPSFIIVPSWVACWVRVFNEWVVVAVLVTCVTANNGFRRAVIFLSLHTQRTLTFITSLHRAFKMPKMTELREPLQSNSSLVLTLLWLFLNLILLAFF